MSFKRSFFINYFMYIHDSQDVPLYPPLHKHSWPINGKGYCIHIELSGHLLIYLQLVK